VTDPAADLTSAIAMRILLPIRAVFFTLLFPGMVTGVVPYLIVRHTLGPGWPAMTAVRVAAFLLAVSGTAVLLHCIWSFAVRGGGTLAPIDPPRRLVVRGSYRHTRNPMYLAVITVLAAETIFFESGNLLAYAVVVMLVFHLMVILYEEPHLKNTFGRPYEEYCRSVPRWRIAYRPFRGAD
jgi:protein-S-isoprenylcysteine O-methyltransferase Ste14